MSTLYLDDEMMGYKDIFTGRNCHSATISNYIKKGWKLPKTIDIDKQFKFSERSGYFITMNNW
jgi:hypothetical protein